MRLEVLKPAPRSDTWFDVEPVIRPAETVTVDYDPKPVLHLPGGRVLIRRAGF